MTGQHWFEGLADHLGSAYLRYSFTYGTEQEVDFLVEVLGLTPGQRVLDVGCGPGRHAHALARRGIEVLGVDVSATFVALAAAAAPAGATFRRLDARALPFEAEFDAAISLCQGAFGLAGGGPGTAPAAGDPTSDTPTPGNEAAAWASDPDLDVLAGMARALRPGAALAVSAFSAYFQVRHLEAADSFDAERGVNHEHTEIRDPAGRVAATELWTTCFTPRELRLAARGVGLTPEAVWSVSPGSYARRRPDLDHHEFLLLARRS